MPSLCDQSQHQSQDQNQAKRGIYWLAIVRIGLVQVLVLLALAGAVVRYLDWSSDTNWAEFTAASEPSARDSRDQSQSATPAQTVKSKTSCYPRS